MLSAGQLVHWSVGNVETPIEHIRAVAAAELAVHPVVTAQPTDLHQELTTAAQQLEADTLWPLMVRLAGLEAAPNVSLPVLLYTGRGTSWLQRYIRVSLAEERSLLSCA